MHGITACEFRDAAILSNFTLTRRVRSSAHPGFLTKKAEFLTPNFDLNPLGETLSYLQPVTDFELCAARRVGTQSIIMGSGTPSSKIRLPILPRLGQPEPKGIYDHPS